MTLYPLNPNPQICENQVEQVISPESTTNSVLASSNDLRRKSEGETHLPGFSHKTSTNAVVVSSKSNTSGTSRLNPINKLFSKIKPKRLFHQRGLCQKNNDHIKDAEVHDRYIALHSHATADNTHMENNEDEESRPPKTIMRNDSLIAVESTREKRLINELCHWYINRSWQKKLLTFLVVSSSQLVLYDLCFNKGEWSHDIMDEFLIWLRQHPVLGVWAYIGAFGLTSLLFIPPSVLVFASGFIFRSVYGPLTGPFIALIASYIGALLGGTIGFIRAHYMTRDLIRILMRRYPILRAIDAAIVRNSLRVMILLRLNPLIPFGMLNYIFGLSGVSSESFVLGIVGVVPWHLWLISLGASANSIYADEADTSVMSIILMGMGSACGVIGLVITWRFAKKELQKEVDSERVYQQQNEDPIYDIEQADLDFADYLCIQYFGLEVTQDGVEVTDSYRSNLTWAARMLDNFS